MNSSTKPPPSEGNKKGDISVPATIEELEALLNSEDDTPVQIMPDGTVRPLNQPAVTADASRPQEQPRKATGEQLKDAARAFDEYPSDASPYVNARLTPNGCARLEAAINAALAVSVSPAAAQGWQPTYRHKKRGTEYEIVGNAYLQTDKPLLDMTPLVIYRGRDGSLWARSGLEFYDGRFEAAAPPSPQGQK